MRIDYTDPVIRRLLITKINSTIHDQVASQIQELQDDTLVKSKLTSAIAEVLDYLDDNLIIKFKD